MNQDTLLIMVGSILAGFFALGYFINKKLSDLGSKKDDSSVVMLNQNIQGMQKMLEMKLSESTKAMQDQFRSSAGIIRDVTEKLVKLEDTNKQIVGVADQLQGLENILKNPKQRGILGEYYLETLLKNLFTPSQYQMQYKFKDGEIADAVIFVKDHIIPIDSKF